MKKAVFDLSRLDYFEAQNLPEHRLMFLMGRIVYEEPRVSYSLAVDPDFREVRYMVLERIGLQDDVLTCVASCMTTESALAVRRLFESC